MTRDFLRELGLNDEQVNSIIAEHGKDINNEKKKLEAIKEDSAKLEESTKKIASLEEALAKANESIDAKTVEMAEKDKAIKGYEISAMRSRVASEMGFSFDAIDFIKGETEEEIRESAEALHSLIGSKKTMPLADPEPNGGTSEKAAFKSMLNNLI